MRSVLIAATAIAIYAPFAHAGVEDDLRDGDKAFENSDWKKAAAAYDRAIASSPGQVSAEAYGKRAAIFTIQKDYKGGLDFIARTKGRYPNAPEVLEQEALMLWETGKRDEAITISEKVVKSKPQSFLTQDKIGEYYSSPGRNDPIKTATAYEAYLANRPTDLEGRDVLPRIRLGFAYIANARSVLGDGDEDRAKQLYGKAAEQFEIVARKFGKKPHAQVNSDNGLCAAYAGLGRWDQAISVCERVVQNPGRVDSNASVYYNLATAYLARKQTKKARERASDFAAKRKNEARGFMLIGDTFFEDRDWNAALDQYLRAEKALKPNQQRELVQLSIKLGKTYRRLPAPAGAATNPYLANAIDKLQTAQSANPNSVELAIELGGAYLEAKQDQKAFQLTDKLLSSQEIGKAPADDKTKLLVINGKSLFNQNKLKESRERFEEARKLRANDVTVARALVTVINQQAFAEGKDYNTAEALLKQALQIDKDNAQTLTNLAVLSIERGNCQDAVAQLQKLGNVRGIDAVKTQRLLGRSYLCIKEPNNKKAGEAFAAAEREAKKANSPLLAEIYVEWAPLTWDADIETAVDRLEVAVNMGGQDPEVGPAAKRNLAIALYKRGWTLLKQGKGTEATSDFERALRVPDVLRGTESLAFEFSLGLAQLDAGRNQEAAKTFTRVASKGNQSAYLKGGYAKDNGAFFNAYANYRSQNGAQRQAACEQLERLSVQIGGRSRDIAAACFEQAAVDFYRAGSTAAAQAALKKVDTLGNASQKKRVDVDLAAMSLGKAYLGALEALNGDPPEALVNLGIIYDQMDKPKEAYDAWTRAKAKGANAPNLQKWIEAKKRIYGY